MCPAELRGRPACCARRLVRHLYARAGRAGMTKNSLASPWSDGPEPDTAVPEGMVTLSLIGGATGRTERTVRTIAALEPLTRSQPVKVLPVQSSQTVPGGILTLLTSNGVMRVVGPSTVRPGPAKCVCRTILRPAPVQQPGRTCLPILLPRQACAPWFPKSATSGATVPDHSD